MLTLRELAKTYRDPAVRHDQGVLAVDGVSLTVSKGQIVSLLGPSGCGKTTTLRMVAGLEEPDWGTIAVDDRILFSREDRIAVPPNRRGLGMVFQSYAIWPHMTVKKNVVFGLKGLRRDRRVPRRDLSRRAERALEAVGLEHLANRPATKLSGGQQQRLALARAIAAEPPVLLLDEPLSNLDVKLRDSVRIELKSIQRQLGITTLYVTHDQIEAMALADVVVVMNHGRVVQSGTPDEVYNLPTNEFVARFIGTTNFILGDIRGREPDGLYRVATPHGLVGARAARECTRGETVKLAIRPENVVLSPPSPSADASNRWRGELVTKDFVGEAINYEVLVGADLISVRSDPREPHKRGDLVELDFLEGAFSILNHAEVDRVASDA